MANRLNRAPWVLDTASAAPIKSSPNPNCTLVFGVIFYGYTDAAHKCQFKDDQGVIIIDLVGAFDLSPVSWYFSSAYPKNIFNLTLSLLDSGKVEVITA